MAWFLYLISAAWIAIGSCAILYTTETRNTFRNFISTTHHKVLAVLPFVMGVLLIISASAGTHPWLIGILGCIGLIKGGFVFLNPNGLYDKIIQWYMGSVSDIGYRLIGIITVILGTAVLSWIA